jgi:hypothetical protein
MTVTGIPSAWIRFGRLWRCPVRVVLGRRREQYLVALAVLDELADRRRGVGSGVHERHRAAVSGAPDQVQRVLARPVGGVGMVLGRHHQRDVAVVVRPPLDLFEQPGRRLRAVGDHEQPPCLSVGHGAMEPPGHAPRVIPIA